MVNPSVEGLKIGKIYNAARRHVAVNEQVSIGLTSPPRYNITWKTFALPLIGIAAFVIYIYVFNVDIQEIFGEVQKIKSFYYVLAIAVSLLDIFLFTVAWQSLLRFLSVKFPVLKLFAFVWIGIYVDTIIPAESVSGEIAKIYLVNKEQNGTSGRATASIVAHRLISMGITIVTLIVGAALLLVQSLLYGIMLSLILFLIAMVCLFFVVVVFFSFRETWTFRMLDGLIRFAEWISRGRWKLTKLREEVIQTQKDFHVAVKEFVHAPKTLFTASLFSSISWVCALLVYYFTFQAIGYPQIPWSAILVISAIFVAVKSIPIGVPFEVGLPEITLTVLLQMFGVPVGIAATATVLSRLLTLWLRFFIGFGAQQWLGIKAIVSGSEQRDYPAMS
jgi:uncharacterized protein (TIRG00374 family)